MSSLHIIVTILLFNDILSGQYFRQFLSSNPVAIDVNERDKLQMLLE